MKSQAKPFRLLSLLFVLGACASAPKEKITKDEKPFIKLANRDLALVIHWRGHEVSPAYHQQVERALARQLKTTYRTRVHAYRFDAPYAGLSPNLTLELVQKDIDDVVIVEVIQETKDESVLTANAEIMSFATQDTLHKLKIRKINGKGQKPLAKRVADMIWVRIRNTWTDPGQSPLLDPLVAANRLADRKACDHALKIYQEVFNDWRPRTILDIQRYNDADKRQKRCAQYVKVRNAIRADREAKFEVKLELGGLSNRFKEALQKAFKKSRLNAPLRKMTNKPVTISVRPGHFTLSLRYHPRLYAKRTSKRPKYLRGQPVIYLDVFEALMSALLEFRERAIEELPPFDKSVLNDFGTALVLNKVLGDQVEVNFADIDGKILLTDFVRVKVGQRQEVQVKSVIPRVTQSRQFVIGPPESASGALTKYGLVYNFFELKP